MELIFFCRICADLCLYFAYAAFLLPYFADASLGMDPMFVIAVAALCAFFLREKRALSLIVTAAALVALLPFGWPLPFAVCVPPWLYVAYIVYKKYFGATYLQQKDSLKRSTRLFPGLVIPLAFTLQVGGVEALATRALPFVLFFVICAIVQLRLLRFDDPALRAPRHQLLHAGIMVLITLIGFALSRSGVYGLITRLIGLAYTNVISPLFAILATIVSVPFIYLIRFFIRTFDIEFDSEFSIDTGGERNPIFEAVETAEGAPEWIKWIFVALFAALVIWLLFRFFRMLLGRTSLTVKKPDQSYETREAIRIENPSLLHRIMDLSSIRGRIRAQFRQLCVKLSKDGRLSPGDTSRSVIEKSIDALPQDKIPDKEAWYGFWDIYLKARYDEREDAVSALDVSKMKEYGKRLQ